MVPNNFGQPMQAQPGRPLNIMLVNDISSIDGFTINPGSSMLFLNESMTEFKMRSRDQNGFLLPERTWTLKETTPPPSQVGFATKEEVSAINKKLDEVLTALKEFTT